MNNLEKIQFTFRECELLNEKAKFMCFSDGIMTYHLVVGKCTYEINVINEDAEFFPEEQVEDLIMRDGIFFLSWRAFKTGVMELLSEGEMYNSPESLSNIEKLKKQK